MDRISLSAQNVVKRYGGVVALADGHLNVHSGEVVALVGANGSGKSTLSKIITGVVAPDGGQLLLNERLVSFPNPQAARDAGITAVYQELSLVPAMTVAENIWLAHEPLTVDGRVDTADVEARTRQLLDLFQGTYHESLHPDALIADLPAAEKQIVEILKALSLEPRMMILDEATASLDSRQVERLFELIQDWKTSGMALVFVSHRMGEIFQIGDRVTVLRNGRTVGQDEVAQISEEKLVALMVGEETGDRKESIKRIKKALDPDVEETVALSVSDLATDTLHGLSFEVRRGELLGIGGLQGQGQRDLLLALFGDVRHEGEILLFDRQVDFHHPRQAMREGVALVPGERGKEGLLPIRSILENLHLPNWRQFGRIVDMDRARKQASEIAERLSLVMSSLEAPVNSLSGGNAQKVVIGKWLLRDPQLLLLDDPTKGVDVHTKTEFYSLLASLSDAGTTILFYSSDDAELLGLCDRVLVLHDGVITANLTGEQLTRANLISASMGAGAVYGNSN